MLASSQETRVVKTGMDESSGTSIISTRPKKRYRSLEERRQIVEEALAPGVSVAAVARARGVNANLLFHWRKLYPAGLLSASAERGIRLLPHRIHFTGHVAGNQKNSLSDHRSNDHRCGGPNTKSPYESCWFPRV